MLALSVGPIGCGGEGAPEIMQYHLTISSTGRGSVTTPGEGTGSFTYGEGEVVDLVAEAAEGYQFAGWTGDVGTIADVSDATPSITMSDDYSITANFGSEPWDYTIELSFHCPIWWRSALGEYVYKPWIAEVEALTGSQGGRFNVTETYGDIPFVTTTSLLAISSGVVDMGQLFPETFHLGGIGYLPWFFPDMESAAYATYYLWTEGNQKWDRGELSGVKILITSPTWPVQWWGNVEVKTPADLDGVKVRCEGAEADTILALGATPVDLGTSDLAGALQTHVVDGCFFHYGGIGGWSGVGANTEYTTELNMFSRVFSLAMNKAVYDSLPAEARAALDSVCGAAKSVELAAANYAGMAADRADTETGPMWTQPAHPEWGRPIYVPTTDELDAWKDATANVAGNWIAYMDTLGFDGQGIYDRAQELIAQYEAS